MNIIWHKQKLKKQLYALIWKDLVLETNLI